MLSQLQQFKLLDIALIQSCGFPVRLKHSNFLKNYGALFVDNTQIYSDVEKCNSVLSSANIKEWHVGKTMVTNYNLANNRLNFSLWTIGYAQAMAS